MVPSAGLLGIAAALCAIGWIAAAFVYGGPMMGAMALAATALLCPVVFVLATRIWPRTPIGRAILIGDAPQQGRESSAWIQQRAKLVGRRGRTVSPMRPSGAIEIDGHQYDAIADGTPLAAEVPITVTAVEGNSLIVAAVEPGGLIRTAVDRTGDDARDRQIPDPFEEPLG